MSKARTVIKYLATLFVLLTALPGFAQCTGTNLLHTMDPKDRAALEAASASQPYPKGILWHATRGTQSIHLVGTMHFFDPRHDATFTQAKPWIDAATTILLEAGEGDEARLQDKIAREPGLAFILQGPTLIDQLTPENWTRLRAAMAERGVPGFMVAKMKPWMALVTLSLSKCALLDQQNGRRGLDFNIIDYAKQIGNPAQALEPYDTALSLFEQYTNAEMLDFLRLFLGQEKFDPNDQHFTLIEAYFNEDIRILWDLAVYQALADPQGMTRQEILDEYARLEEALLKARNLAWMDRILPAAETGPVFLAAGALHLPGEFGVLNLLALEGFTITPIARTP